MWSSPDPSLERCRFFSANHTATVRSVAITRLYEFDDAATFLVSQPSVATLIAKTLAQRLYESTTNLADIKRQYANLRGIFLLTRNR
jgi:hypothetical protein